MSSQESVANIIQIILMGSVIIVSEVLPYISNIKANGIVHFLTMQIQKKFQTVATDQGQQQVPKQQVPEQGVPKQVPEQVV